MSIVNLAAKYKDVLTLGFSILSFLIACTSLFCSGRTAWHDRSRLKITGRVVYEPVYEKAYKIQITVLNVGRRDAVLEGVLCHYEGDKAKHVSVKEGIILKEKQRTTFEIDSFDIIMNGEEGSVYQLEDISILDVEGKKHPIPNSVNLVTKFIKER